MSAMRTAMAEYGQTTQAGAAVVQAINSRRQERHEAETQGQRQHRLPRISANQELRFASETKEARSARLQRLRENGHLRQC